MFPCRKVGDIFWLNNEYTGDKRLWVSHVLIRPEIGCCTFPKEKQFLITTCKMNNCSLTNCIPGHRVSSKSQVLWRGVGGSNYINVRDDQYLAQMYM